jgi:hypothetical protein
MHLTWSPRSNASLYGNTTNIPAAIADGVKINIGPDWSMGGSQNMLDELRFADAWDDSHWNDILSAEDLVKMATVNPASSLQYTDLIGSIQVGLYADLFVVDGDAALPYESIVAAAPPTVRLTMVGGKILYGDAALKPVSALPASCEDLDTCGRSKFVCVAEASATTKFNQKLSDITTTLNSALAEADTLSGGTFPVSPLPPLYRCPTP